LLDRLVLLNVDVDLNMRTEFVLPCLSPLYDVANVKYFYDIFFSFFGYSEAMI
jgi:hypothetical protein